MISHTPLHLAWEGTSAVYVFFILSGLVLVLPYLDRSPDWARYYPSRLIRLYLPTIAAVCFGFVTILLVLRIADSHLSDWAQRAGYEDPLRIAKDILLIGGSSGVISPLWSLQWEILFSLLLPAFVVATGLLATRWRTAILALMALVAYGTYVKSPIAVYFPMFLLGGIVATRLKERPFTSRRARSKSRYLGGRWGQGLILIGAMVLLSVRWFPWTTPTGLIWPIFVRVANSFGALLLVYLSLPGLLLYKILSLKTLQFLGKISFSLYLIHEPIVLALVRLFPHMPRGYLALLMVLASLVLAFLFWRVVERPTLELARRAKRRSADLASVPA